MDLGGILKDPAGVFERLGLVLGVVWAFLGEGSNAKTNSMFKDHTGKHKTNETFPNKKNIAKPTSKP